MLVLLFALSQKPLVAMFRFRKFKTRDTWFSPPLTYVQKLASVTQGDLLTSFIYLYKGFSPAKSHVLFPSLRTLSHTASSPSPSGISSKTKVSEKSVAGSQLAVEPVSNTLVRRLGWV